MDEENLFGFNCCLVFVKFSSFFDDKRVIIYCYRDDFCDCNGCIFDKKCENEFYLL